MSRSERLPSSARALPAATVALALGLLSGCGGDPASPPHGRATPDAPETAATSADPSASPDAASTARSFRALEERYHANIGVFLLDTGTGRSVAYQADRRFAMCSTAKALAAGAVLRKDDDARLGRTLTYDRSDLLDYAPVTSQHVDHGMALSAVLAAALQYSDNTAENLMLRELGGPPGLQRAVRELGDTTTHVNRTEPTLNEAAPGDIRDTSTARALATDLRALLLGNALPAAPRARLTDWMVHNTTGDRYIRAALPHGWRAADKTGSGGHGTRNDIGVVWPGQGAPTVISVMTNRTRPNDASDDTLIADAVRAGLSAWGRSPS